MSKFCFALLNVRCDMVSSWTFLMTSSSYSLSFCWSFSSVLTVFLISCSFSWRSARSFSMSCFISFFACCVVVRSVSRYSFFCSYSCLSRLSCACLSLRRSSSLIRSCISSSFFSLRSASWLDHVASFRCMFFSFWVTALSRCFTVVISSFSFFANAIFVVFSSAVIFAVNAFSRLASACSLALSSCARLLRFSCVFWSCWIFAVFASIVMLSFVSSFFFSDIVRFASAALASNS